MSFTDFNDMLQVWSKAEAFERINQIVQAGIDQLKTGKPVATRELSQGESAQSAPENNDELPPIEAYTPPEAAQDAGIYTWQNDVQRNEKGAIKPMVSNIVLILSNDPRFKGALAYCDMSYRILKRREILPQMKTGEWTDADTSHVLNWLGVNYYFDPPEKKVIAALVVVAQHHRFHPVREYLQGLKWDGTPRINHWLEDMFDARPKNEDTALGHEYLAWAGRYFLVGAVARAMEAPVKMDNVIILEGSQGEGKSTALNVLFGDWFSDSPVPIGNKDAYQVIQGTWCCELAELDSFNKAESTSAKQFFSSKSDRYRPSYGVMAQDFPRQCVFAGTTNQDEYLKDYTGNRRYWPVYCATVDIAAIRAMRDQLWAEALHVYRQGLNLGNDRDKDTRWWPDKDEERALFYTEQDARLQMDSWHFLIEDYLYKENPEHIHSSELLELACNKPTGTHTKADQNRLAPIMKALGWANKRKRIAIPGAKQKQPRHVYVQPENWNEAAKGGSDAPL